MVKNKYALVLSTVPDEKTGETIARELVENRLAACVTISSACQSLYWWEEKISQDRELVLFVKTKASLYSELERRIKELHPYKVPEIIAVPIAKGYRKYLSWLDKETKS